MAQTVVFDLVDGRSAPRNAATERRRRAGAVTGSLLLHVLILVFGFGAATGAVVSGGGGSEKGDFSAVTVQMASLPGDRRSAPDPQVQQLALLYRKILANQAEVEASDVKRAPQDSAERLFDAIDQKSQADKGNQRGDGATDANGVAHNAQATTSRRGDHSSIIRAQGPGDAVSTGALWGEVQPCWSKLPGASSVPVTLDIILDDSGRIALPPKIVRPDTTVPQEARLISEARALAAVAGCVPYHSPDGQRELMISFAPGGG